MHMLCCTMTVSDDEDTLNIYVVAMFIILHVGGIRTSPHLISFVFEKFRTDIGEEYQWHMIAWHCVGMFRTPLLVIHDLPRLHVRLDSRLR